MTSANFKIIEVKLTILLSLINFLRCYWLFQIGSKDNESAILGELGHGRVWQLILCELWIFMVIFVVELLLVEISNKSIKNASWSNLCDSTVEFIIYLAGI